MACTILFDENINLVTKKFPRYEATIGCVFKTIVGNPHSQLCFVLLSLFMMDRGTKLNQPWVSDHGSNHIKLEGILRRFYHKKKYCISYSQVYERLFISIYQP